ncbi:MAG: MFS transporter [Candidatus Bathyarchaeia archaeon]
MSDLETTRNRSAKGVLTIVTVSHTMQHLYVGMSVLFPLIITDLNISYTEFGLIMAVSLIMGGLPQIAFSILSRKAGRHLLLGLGNLLLSIGTFLMGLAHNAFHFLCGRVVANLGTAPQHPMGTAIISEEFDGESVSRAIGIHFGVAYIGNIIGPLIMTALAVAIGWRNTLLIFSMPMLIVGISVILYLRWIRQDKDASSDGRSSSIRSDLRSVMRARGVIPIILAQVMASGGIDLGILTTYMPIFLSDALKLNISDRGFLYTILLVGGVLGPVVLGKYVNSLGHLRTILICSSISTLCLYLLTLYNTANPTLLANLFVLGFTSFSLPTLIQSHLVRITRGFGRDLVVGMYFTIGFGFSSIWAAAIGKIIDVYKSFTPALILMGTLGSLASLVFAEQLRKFKG